MQFSTTRTFQRWLGKLPQEVQERALKSFQLWLDDPQHPSLHFKKVHPIDPIYSARIGGGYRVVGSKKDDRLLWFWVGPHDEYERILSQL